MHNNIMAFGSRDRPPMLATERYAQWQSRFMRYVDTKPNGEDLENAYYRVIIKLSTVIILRQLMICGYPLKGYNRVNLLTSRMSRLVCFGSLADLLQEMESQLSHTTPEWSRFVTVVKQTVDLDKESYHKLFDIMKQYQKEILISKHLTLQVICTTIKETSSTRSHVSTKHKGKKISKPITPPSELASEEDSDPKQAQRDKDMQKKLARIAKYFKKIYKPTNNNLRTSSNTKNKNVDTSPRKPKREKHYTYHKEKMLLCKQAEKCVPLQAEQADWLEDTYEPLEKVHSDDDYNVFTNVGQHFEQPISINNTCLVEKVDSNVIPDSSDMCDNDNQADKNAEECDDERVVLANLKLDTDKNKKIQKQFKKTNTSLAHELQEYKSTL
ncbi:hypothetical protein Tco_1063314 [Tanacetum coccineum]